MLGQPRNEFPQFPAALSFVMLLTPDEAAAVLDQRAELLRAQLAAVDADLASVPAALPRIVLMDDDYRRTMLRAELAWVEDVARDLASGAWTWSYEEFAAILDGTFQPDGDVITAPPDL
jgi:hypothetical protein